MSSHRHPLLESLWNKGYRVHTNPLTSLVPDLHQYVLPIEYATGSFRLYLACYSREDYDFDSLTNYYGRAPDFIVGLDEASTELSQPWKNTTQAMNRLFANLTSVRAQRAIFTAYAEVVDFMERFLAFGETSMDDNVIVVCICKCGRERSFHLFLSIVLLLHGLFLMSYEDADTETDVRAWMAAAKLKSITLDAVIPDLLKESTQAYRPHLNLLPLQIGSLRLLK
jgi:hypothetical protein